MTNFPSGPVRLLIAILAGWVVVWGGVYAYADHQLGDFESRAEAAVELVGKMEADGRSTEATAIVDGLESETVRMDTLASWYRRAKMFGPTGFAVILFGFLGGVWVYRGFRISR